MLRRVNWYVSEDIATSIFWKRRQYVRSPETSVRVLQGTRRHIAGDSIHNQPDQFQGCGRGKVKIFGGPVEIGRNM